MKNNKLLSFVASSVLICALGFGLAGCRQSDDYDDAASAQQETASQSQDAEEEPSVLDAAVYTADGQKVLVSELADGKPLVINMWTTWCPNCVEELPTFLDLVRKYDGRVTFLFVDVPDGDEESARYVVPWLEEHGLSDLPVVYDTDVEVAQTLNLQAYPTTVVYNSSGELVDMQLGAIDSNAMSGLLNTLS